MKSKSSKLISLFLVVLLSVMAFVPSFVLNSKAAPSRYETTGLKALYMGNNNTGNGQDTSATTWKDLSGNGNDIASVAKDSKSFFTQNAYNLNTSKNFFPQGVVDVVNGNEFTVELVVGNFTPIATSFNTFINSANDNFALFRRVSGDFIEFKNSTNLRPKVAGGEDYFKNSTVTITYKVGGKCTMYVDGVQIGQTDAVVSIKADNLWFGHDDPTRNYDAQIHSMRFYSNELTAAQVAANSKGDQINFFGGNGYEKTGLKALYMGNNNTGSGQDTSVTTWKDLSGNGNDIATVAKDGKSFFTQIAYNLNTSKNFFPQGVVDVVNGDEFTVELVVGNFTPIATSFNTFINSANDKFALFRRVAGDFIEFKNNTNARPKVAGGEDYIKNSTITITYKVGGKCTMYVDGVQIGQTDAVVSIQADNLWFGHDDPTRNYDAQFHSMRFYNKELTAAQVAANSAEDQLVFFAEPDTSSETGSSEASSEVSSETSVVTSDSSVPSDISSSTPSVDSSVDDSSEDDPITGDTGIVVFGLIAVVASIGVFAAIKKRSVSTH